MNYEQFIERERKKARMGALIEAEKAARATLEVLAEHIKKDHARALGDQIPEEIKKLLREVSSDSPPEKKKEGLGEFFTKVSERENVSLSKAIHHSKVVISVLKDLLYWETIEKIKSQLSWEIGLLFEEVSSFV